MSVLKISLYSDWWRDTSNQKIGEYLDSKFRAERLGPVTRNKDQGRDCKALKRYPRGANNPKLNNIMV